MSRITSLVAVSLVVFALGPLASVSESAALDLQTVDPLGLAVAVLAPDGTEVARVSVETVQDPFENYDFAYPPIRGYHYVMLELSVDATGSGPIRIDPSQVFIRDTHGFLYGDATIYREEEAAAPDLDYQDLEAGSSTAGAIGFQVLNGVTLADIWLAPGSGVLIQLVDFGTATSPSILDDVSWLGYEGGEIAIVAAREFIDPFDGYDDDYPPDRGMRYVMVTITIENTGPRPLQTDSSDFILQDGDGFLYGAQTIYQPGESEKPDLEYGELEPGDFATGSIGFIVPVGLEIARVLFQPSGDRLLTVVDLSTAAATSREPSAGSTAEPALAGSDLDCDEIEQWLTIAYSEASAVTSIVGVLMVMRIDEDPDYVDLAHQVAEAFLSTAEGLADFDVPHSIDDLNEELAGAFAAYGEATEELATAVESDDQDAIDEAGQAVFDAEPALITAIDGVTALAEECGLAD